MIQQMDIRGFLYIILSSQSLKCHKEIVRGLYQFSIFYRGCNHIKGCIGCILEGVSLPNIHRLRELWESGEGCLGGTRCLDHFGDLSSCWKRSGEIEFNWCERGRKVKGIAVAISIIYCHFE